MVPRKKQAFACFKSRDQRLQRPPLKLPQLLLQMMLLPPLLCWCAKVSQAAGTCVAIVNMPVRVHATTTPLSLFSSLASLRCFLTSPASDSLSVFSATTSGNGRRGRKSLQLPNPQSDCHVFESMSRSWFASGPYPLIHSSSASLASLPTLACTHTHTCLHACMRADARQLTTFLLPTRCWRGARSADR